MNNFGLNKFRAFRIILGVYLATIFAQVIPYVGDLFGSSAMFAGMPSQEKYYLFGWITEPRMLQIALVLFAGLGLLFAMGIFRKGAALILWFAWTSLSLRMPYMNIPSDPFIGWLLLASLAIPDEKQSSWQMPRGVFWAAWIVFALAYTFSGLQKYSSASWQEGTVLQTLLQGPLAREYFFTDFLRSQTPAFLLATATYSTLWLEILFAPLALFRPTRKFIWTAGTLFHIAVLLTCQLAHVSIAMILVHIFLFDDHWVKTKR